MFTVKERNISQIEVEKSKFIGIVGPLFDSNDFKNILLELKKEFPQARHYCYAYVCEDGSKSSDDGEPSGTAGKPLLTLLQGENLTNVYLVVVRYFGGIKLGASRLLRTYVDAGKCSINSSSKFEICEVNRFHIDHLPYDIFYQLKKLDVEIENISYQDDVSLDIISKDDIVELLNTVLKGNYKITVNKETRLGV